MRSLPNVGMTEGAARDDKRGQGLTKKEAQYHNHTNSFLNQKTRLDVGSAKTETTNSLNSLFVKIRVIRGQTLSLHSNEIPP